MKEFFLRLICVVIGHNEIPYKYVDLPVTTKKFRGILCCGCNSAIGHTQESPERLEAVAEYLREKQRAI